MYNLQLGSFSSLSLCLSFSPVLFFSLFALFQSTSFYSGSSIKYHFVNPGRFGCVNQRQVHFHKTHLSYSPSNHFPLQFFFLSLSLSLFPFPSYTIPFVHKLNECLDNGTRVSLVNCIPRPVQIFPWPE